MAGGVSFDILLDVLSNVAFDPKGPLKKHYDGRSCWFLNPPKSLCYFLRHVGLGAKMRQGAKT